jgi:hypothetical protein
MTRLWPKGEPVEILGAQEIPAGFVWQRMPHHILTICNRWRIHTRWWEPDEAVWREYLKVETDDGLLCLLYRDLVHGSWFLARVYD